MPTMDDDRMFEILFQQLVMSLAEAAMIQLGKIVNPATGKPERNLAQARGTIDLLRMLKAKTEKGLGEQEQRLLEQNLLNLQMNYVYEAEQHPEEDQKAEAASAPAEEAAEEPAAEEETQAPETGGEGGGEGEEGQPGNRPGQNN